MGACPIQIIFCLKEQNKKKLNSHRWFFNAFGPLIKPNGACRAIYYRMVLNKLPVCVLLDVGTKPTSTSIYELWKCGWNVLPRFHDLISCIGFDMHANVGGACGESVQFRAIYENLTDVLS